MITVPPVKPDPFVLLQKSLAGRVKIRPAGLIHASGLQLPVLHRLQMFQRVQMPHRNISHLMRQKL